MISMILIKPSMGMDIKLKLKSYESLLTRDLIGQWMLNFDYGPCVVSDWSVGPYLIVMM